MTNLKNIFFTFFMISLVALQSCKQAEEAVNFLQNEKKEKIQDKNWEVDWTKTYEGASLTALFTKTALQAIGTGVIRFNSDGKVVHVSVISGTKDLGKWDINALNQLTISDAEKSAFDVIPTSKEDFFLSIISNATVKSVTDTELQLTPGITASLLGLGTGKTFYFKVKP